MTDLLSIYIESDSIPVPLHPVDMEGVHREEGEAVHRIAAPP